MDWRNRTFTIVVMGMLGAPPLSVSLGIDRDISSFDSRLRIQKIVYILKAMGVNLKYPFEFYKSGHGVYSRKLAEDYYHFKQQRNSNNLPV